MEEFIEPSVYSSYEEATSQRLIVVANRLPVSAVRERNGSWSLQARSTHAIRLSHACISPLTCIAAIHVMGAHEQHQSGAPACACMQSVDWVMSRAQTSRLGLFMGNFTPLRLNAW